MVPVDPEGSKLISRYPLPNDPQGPYGARTSATHTKVTTVSDQLSLRMDHRLSDKSQLFLRITGENTEGPLTDPSQTVFDRDFVVGSPTSSGTRRSPIRYGYAESYGEPL